MFQKIVIIRELKARYVCLCVYTQGTCVYVYKL
jgi:hypothetical protein